MKETESPLTATAQSGSLDRFVRPVSVQPTRNESEFLQMGQENQGGIGTHNASIPQECIDLSIPLPTVLSLLECPRTGMLGDLARTSPHVEEVKALLSLWQSLGRPVSGFWQHTRVFVNRQLLSYWSNAGTQRPGVLDKANETEAQSPGSLK